MGFEENDMARRKVIKKKIVKDEGKVNIREKMTELFELPKEIVLDLPKITMVGNNNIIIENYKGIVEYDNNNIRVNTSNGIIKIDGGSLVIREITSEDLLIEGNINMIEFQK